MEPIRIILLIVVVAVYAGLLWSISVSTHTTDKTKDGEKVDRPITTRDKVFMFIGATGIGGLLVKYIVEWQ